MRKGELLDVNLLLSYLWLLPSLPYRVSSRRHPSRWCHTLRRYWLRKQTPSDTAQSTESHQARYNMGKKRKSMPVTFTAPSLQKTKLKTSPGEGTSTSTMTINAAPLAGLSHSSPSFSILERAFEQLACDPLDFLVGEGKRASFLEKHWESAPSVFPSTPERLAFFHHLLSLEDYLKTARERDEKGEEKGRHSFRLGVDVNAARYVHGQRETHNATNRGQGTASTLSRLHEQKGCTLQVLQPQRWDDKCWRLAAALEAQFGCLVGVNAYLTPGGTQGLAPHSDPVEIFVIQTEGKKAWRLYAPMGNFALPNQASGDLKQEEIGTPSLEVVLSPGDVLYMPRGTVHQAVAEGGREGGRAASAHLTLSTYQQWSYADWATHIFQVVGHNVTFRTAPSTFPLALRRSPPPGPASSTAFFIPPPLPQLFPPCAAWPRACARWRIISSGTRKSPTWASGPCAWTSGGRGSLPTQPPSLPPALPRCG
ncbi:myc-induced nuclear antigen [Nannochloropsis gaditana]|uniref:Bifunctional lysine-specific demethylase and histidyl-hydroxylase n=1 Tax=Nannochloropsis gaditana TaxID=72520 RepID=W7TFG8_9STRA|nr:myc-induced nuclear antigen [Nannochloropsis gaditana]